MGVAFNGDSLSVAHSLSAVTVKGGDIDDAKFILTCPAKAAGSATVQCTIAVKGGFGNVADGARPQDAATFLIDASGLPTNKFPAIRAVPEVSGEYTVTLGTPSSGSIRWLLSWCLLAVGSASSATIQAEMVQLSPSSAVECSPTRVTAGDRVSCVLSVVDGAGAAVGDSSLISAIQGAVSNAGQQMSATVSNVAQGVYTLQFTPVRVGFADVAVRYTTGGTALLLSPDAATSTRSARVEVQAADVDAGKSKFWSTSGGVAGSQQSCYMTLNDRNRNAAGDSSALSAIAVGSSNLAGTPEWVRGVAGMGVGMDVRASITPTAAGTFTAQGTYFGSLVGSAKLHITGGAVHAPSSSFECSAKFQGNARATCVIPAKDQYGNLATV